MSKGPEDYSTVGEAALALQQCDDTIHAVELERAIHKGNKSSDSWESQIEECLIRGMSRFEGDFYLTVLTKKERLLHNVIRRYFIDRKSCPTPEFDQTVFRYIRREDVLEYLWTVPDIQTCHELKANGPHLSEELIELYHMVMAFHDGKLDKLCEKLNLESEPIQP